MSCNGCRALRKGCSDSCILRPCLQWIDSPQSQAHATVFVARFFGRSDLMSFISSVPLSHRPALFQSLLYEACGRTVNPVNGAVGLLWGRNWHICQAAVETVLAGGTLRPIPGLAAGLTLPECVHDSSEAIPSDAWKNPHDAYFSSPLSDKIAQPPSSLTPRFSTKIRVPRGGSRAAPTSSYSTDLSVTTTATTSGTVNDDTYGAQERKLLNLFI
ncbi:LOB domain-containing protein 39-like [Malania oleifera]|uniref:LOB domain-containing protein 39-like n=1 Tax=Malania oleifera TaxID=397392 RepID=UPI0025AE0845|nr:LOB domain-containing protein 39-like [Malania oleifera]